MEDSIEILKINILKKKELRGITPEFLDKFIDEYKQKHKKEFDKLIEKKFNEKSKEFDVFKKEIRKKLRELHGVFSKDTLGIEKKEKYLDLLKNTNDLEEKEIMIKILKRHRSTIERLDFYEDLYSKIFESELIEKNQPHKILDLGCGYNPFSYIFLKHYLKQTSEYVGIDINEEDSKFIQTYFDIKKIKGKSLTIDLTEEKNMDLISQESKSCDVCFLFKLLDSLEAKKRGSSSNLLNHLNSDVLIVSFPLKTIGGRSLIQGKRKWFEKIKNNSKYETEEFIVGDEIYYILKIKQRLL